MASGDSVEEYLFTRLRRRPELPSKQYFIRCKSECVHLGRRADYL